MNNVLRPYISSAFSSSIFGYIEEKVETDKGPVTHMILEGEFQRADTPNKNLRIYEEWLLERETKGLQEMIKQRNGNPQGMDHPFPNPSDPPQVQSQIIQRIGMENACALNIQLEMHKGVVYGKSRVLQGDYGTGDKLAAFVKTGFKPAVSSRGLGGDPIQKGEYLYVPESYKMITYDFVSNPSTHNAILEQMMAEEYYAYTHKEKKTKFYEVLIDLSKKYI